MMTFVMSLLPVVTTIGCSSGGASTLAAGWASDGSTERRIWSSLESCLAISSKLGRLESAMWGGR